MQFIADSVSCFIVKQVSTVGKYHDFTAQINFAAQPFIDKIKAYDGIILPAYLLFEYRCHIAFHLQMPQTKIRQHRYLCGILMSGGVTTYHIAHLFIGYGTILSIYRALARTCIETKMACYATRDSRYHNLPVNHFYVNGIRKISF